MHATRSSWSLSNYTNCDPPPGLDPPSPSTTTRWDIGVPRHMGREQPRPGDVRPRPPVRLRECGEEEREVVPILGVRGSRWSLVSRAIGAVRRRQLEARARGFPPSAGCRTRGSEGGDWIVRPMLRSYEF